MITLNSLFNEHYNLVISSFLFVYFFFGFNFIWDMFDPLRHYFLKIVNEINEERRTRIQAEPEVIAEVIEKMIYLPRKYIFLWQAAIFFFWPVTYPVWFFYGQKKSKNRIVKKLEQLGLTKGN